VGQYDKNYILDKLKTKAQSKGFDINPDKSKMSKNVSTLLDMLDLFAETISEVLSQEEINPGTIKTSSLKIGPTGIQVPAAAKDMTVKFDITTDPTFFSWIEMFHGLLQAVYPLPGYGAPNTFAIALQSLLSMKPTSLTGKVVEGSGSVKISI
jgi:hypothetical protein